MLKKFLEAILFSSIFISICAVALCIETNLLLHFNLNSFSFYLFVFGATLVQYNLHYLFKKSTVENSRRLAWTLKNKAAHKILIAIGSALVIISLFSFHLHHFLILLAFGAVALLYSFPFLPLKKKKRIKDFGLLKIITLALLWTMVTVWFPVSDNTFKGTSFYLIFYRRFIFMFVLCLLFDIRDTEIDRKEDISTISVKLGVKKSYTLCKVLLAIFAIISMGQFIYSPEILVLIAMLISAAATVFTINFSKKNNSDFTYLACVDGMMLLQALLVIFAATIQPNLK